MCQFPYRCLDRQDFCTQNAGYNMLWFQYRGFHPLKYHLCTVDIGIYTTCVTFHLSHLPWAVPSASAVEPFPQGSFAAASLLAAFPFADASAVPAFLPAVSWFLLPWDNAVWYHRPEKQQCLYIRRITECTVLEILACFLPHCFPVGRQSRGRVNAEKKIVFPVPFAGVILRQKIIFVEGTVLCGAVQFIMPHCPLLVCVGKQEFKHDLIQVRKHRIFMMRLLSNLPADWATAICLPYRWW